MGGDPGHSFLNFRGRLGGERPKRRGKLGSTDIRGGENPEAGLHYFCKIFNFYFEISNFLLDFLTTIST